MKLDARAWHAVGEFLDQHNVPAEDRRILCHIDGVDYRFDSEGCWCFVNDRYEVGWTRCSPPAALQEWF